MPLDPQQKLVLERRAAMMPEPITSLTPQEARARAAAAVIPVPNPEPVTRVQNRTFPGPETDVPLRIYWPSGRGPFPALVYIHGGGWVQGDLHSADANCRSLTNGGGCVTISVDYRLAPEAKFPKPLADCFAAVQWVADNAASLNIDPDRIAVGGASAGGNLAAAVALLARDEGGPRLVHQLLIYPATDATCASESYKTNGGSEYGLGTVAMHWYWAHYLRNEGDYKHPLASPLFAEDFSNLPPAMIVTAEYDPLRDEGEEYGRRLQAAGTPADIRRYDGVAHGFVTSAAMIDIGKQALKDCGEALRKAFA
jgi:acetyl esterase